MKPAPSTPSQWISLYFKGLIMGVADIIPGISGGTVAFILGFYGTLLESLCTFRGKTFRFLLKGKIATFFQSVAWEYLTAIILGIGTSLIAFSQILSSLLNDSELRTILYSSFFGLILGSVFLCAQQVRQWSWFTKGLFIIGMMVAWQATSFTQTAWIAYSTPQVIDPWLILCGALAVCALLMPGISGSYVLTILGVYASIIAAIGDFTQGLFQGSWETQAFLILANVGVGILLGGLFFSRLINWLLHYHRDITIVVMTGFMLGAIRSLWPFWTSVYMLHPFHPERGLQLITLDPYLPYWTSPLWWVAIPWAIVGFLGVFILDTWAKNKRSAELIHGQAP